MPKLSVRITLFVSLFAGLLLFLGRTAYCRELEESDGSAKPSPEIMEAIKKYVPFVVEEEEEVEVPRHEVAFLATNLDDVNSKDKKDVIVYYSNFQHGKVLVLTKKGGVCVKRWESEDDFPGFFIGVAAGDINHNGKKDFIIEGCNGSRSYTGFTVFEWDNGNAREILSGGGVGWGFKILDIDDSGADEIIVPGYDTGLTIYEWDGKEYRKYILKEVK